MLKHGADKVKNRAIYQLYQSKTVADAAIASPKTKKIDGDVAKEMAREVERINGPDQVMVMSRVNNTNWKYVPKDEHEKRILGQLRRENGGREISQLKQDKIQKKTMFNYNNEQLQIIKEMVTNR